MTSGVEYRPGDEFGEGASIRRVGAVPGVMVIPDAELLLPDEALPPARAYEVYSVHLGGTYTSLGGIIKRRKQVERELSAGLADWQLNLLYGQELWVLVRSVLDAETVVMAYGHVPPVDAFVQQEIADRVQEGSVGDATGYGRRLTRRMERARGAGWLYGQWFSEAQVLGEWACVHAATVVHVGDAAWLEEARQRLWKVTPVNGQDG